MSVSEKGYTMSNDINLKFGSLDPVHGFGASDVVSIEFNEDQWMDSVGQDGEYTRIRNKNLSGKMIITTQRSSESNVDLMNTLNGDLANNLGALPFQGSDDTYTFSSPALYISKIPTVDIKNKEVGTYSWEFKFGLGRMTMKTPKQDY